MKNIWVVGAFVFLISAPAFAWDGVNVDTGSSITIDDGEAIAEGNDVQILDTNSATDRGVTITTIIQTDDAIELTVIDDISGDTETYDFDPADMPDTLELPEPQ